MTSITKGYLTVGNTVWIYPISDIEKALITTQISYKRIGSYILCDSLSDIEIIFLDIINQSISSQPDGNPGYSCGVGTMLEDLRKDFEIKLSTGEVVVRMRLVRQVSPQTTPPVSVPGNSLDNTIGYIVTFCSYGVNANIDSGNRLDPALVVRI